MSGKVLIARRPRPIQKDIHGNSTVSLLFSKFHLIYFIFFERLNLHTLHTLCLKKKYKKKRLGSLPIWQVFNK